MRKLIWAAILTLLVGMVPSIALAADPPAKVGQCASSPTLDTSSEGIPAEPCTGVQRRVDGDGWYLTMPYRGNFGGDPYLNDGWMLNIYTDRQGTAAIYIIVHETDPRFDPNGETIWGGTWQVFREVYAGQGAKE